MIELGNFEDFIKGIKLCYSDDCQEKLPNISDFPSNVFKDNLLDIEQMEKLSETTTNNYLASIINRMLGVLIIQKSREDEINLNLKQCWQFISKSIRLISSQDTISSIGSQGFLSIPLFKFTTEMSEFEFIRLHIWDKSLAKYIDQNASTNFSIHTHSFHAHSWIITGKVINDRYCVTESKVETPFIRFTINYNKTLSKINQHTSTACNDNIYIIPKQISHEVYMSGSTYQIKAGNYHNSGTEDEDGLSATFFCFTAKNGMVDASYVVGPADQKESKINRQMHIDPIYLLDKIEKKTKRFKMTDEKRKMILDWMRKIHQLEYANIYQSIRWSNWEKIIGISAFALSTLIACSYRFPELDPETYDKLPLILKHEFMIPLITTIVAILTGLQTFLKPGEKSEAHRKLGNSYEKLRHKIETVLTGELSEYELNQKVEAIRKEWENMEYLNVSPNNFDNGKKRVKSLNKYPEELGFLPDQKNNG